MRYWEQRFPEEELETFRRSGWGARMGFGHSPVLLVVDVNRNFCGDRNQTMSDSLDKYHMSCGPKAWEAVDAIASLLPTVRAERVPVIYTTGLSLSGQERWRSGRWADKNSLKTGDPLSGSSERQQIVDEIAPKPGEVVLSKAKPSAFFGTPLLSHLIALGIDTVLVCGTTTSGCIRATVLDAFSYDYRIAVIHEATFDRSSVSHDVSLFDMDQKYADVVGAEDVVTYLKSLGGRNTG